jgi:predicted DNA-binding protein (UPF0251 family)
VISPELEAKIKDVLSRLMLLAEGSTTSFDAHVSGSKSKSQPPAGVKLDGNPPNRDTSPPYEWWTWRFANAIERGESEMQFLRLYLLAERDYWVNKHHSANRHARRSGELDRRDISDGGLAERESAKRVCEEYQGVSAEEVAYLYEDVSVEWVRKARRMNGRNPNDGKPRPEFLDLDEDDRLKVAAQMHAKGMSANAAANRLHVSKQTLQRYWPPSAKLAEFQAKLAELSSQTTDSTGSIR